MPDPFWLGVRVSNPTRTRALPWALLVLIPLALSGCLQEPADAGPPDDLDVEPEPRASVQEDWTFRADATAAARRTLHLPAPTAVTFSLSVDRYAGAGLLVDLPGDCEDMAPFGDGATVALANTLGATTCTLAAGTHDLTVSVDGVVEGRLTVRSR